MSDDREATRAWLDLLRASNAIKKAVDTAFKIEFGLSLSRFDIMATLARSGEAGLRAGELSQQLMVTEGNTTQVTAPLIRDGLVRRRTSDKDARVAIFTLTRKGERLFERMAEAHHAWISRTFTEFSKLEIATLRKLLGRLTHPAAAIEAKDFA